jgi:two-component system, NarL family, response regulator DegU
VSRAIKVLIADDHPIFRQGLRQIIDAHSQFTVVDEAENGERVLQILRERETDVLVADITMPGLDGFELVRDLQRSGKKLKVLFLTMHNEEDMFNAAMDLGVKGYVLKDGAATEILSGLEAIADGRHFVSAALTEFVFARGRRTESVHRDNPGLEGLTSAEHRILKLIADNMTSKQIAQGLCLSVRTVENHRTNICAKLGLRGVHSLVKFAFDNKAAF